MKTNEKCFDVNSIQRKTFGSRWLREAAWIHSGLSMISFNFLFLGCWLNYILGIFYVSFRQRLDLKILKCSNFHSTVHVPKTWCIDILYIYIIYNHIQLLLRDWDQHALACFIGEQMMIQPNNTAVHSRAKRIKPSRHRSQVWTSLL